MGLGRQVDSGKEYQGGKYALHMRNHQQMNKLSLMKGDFHFF